MITIPFAEPLGSAGGARSDGVHVGALPRVAFAGVLASSRVVIPSRIVRGDSSSGAMAYTDITVQAQDGAAGDVPPFNATEPTNDELLITVPSTGRVTAVLLDVSTAGAGAGAWVPVVDYDNGTQDVAVALAASPPDLRAVGVARIVFAAPLEVATVTPTKVFASRERRLRLRMGGVTSVATAPLASRVWLEMEAVAYADRTALVATTAPLPSFANVADVILTAGDTDWFLLASPFAKLFATVLGRRASQHGVEWVYWDGSAVVALPAANISDPTDRFGAMPTGAYVSRDLRSTYTGAVWGNSGAYGAVGIAGDGYVEARVTSPATAAGFLGLSITDDGLTYTGIDYGWHFGHGGTAFCSIWSNGAQQAGLTFALAVGDVLRVERRGASMLFRQNGVLRHTMPSAPAGTYRPDIALIFSGGLDQIELVDTSRGYPVWVAFDWAAAPTLATATDRSIQVPTAAERVIAVSLPADAAPLTVSGVTGHALGLRTTSAPGVVRPPCVLAMALALSGAGASGLRLAVARTVTRFGIHCRAESLGAARFLLVNASTGRSLAIDLSAGARYADADGSLAFAAGELMSIVQVSGHGTVEPSDGAFLIQ